MATHDVDGDVLECNCDDSKWYYFILEIYNTKYNVLWVKYDISGKAIKYLETYSTFRTIELLHDFFRFKRNYDCQTYSTRAFPIYRASQFQKISGSDFFFGSDQFIYDDEAWFNLPFMSSYVECFIWLPVAGKTRLTSIYKPVLFELFSQIIESKFGLSVDPLASYRAMKSKNYVKAMQKLYGYSNDVINALFTTPHFQFQYIDITVRRRLAKLYPSYFDNQFMYINKYQNSETKIIKFFMEYFYSKKTAEGASKIYEKNEHTGTSRSRVQLPVSIAVDCGILKMINLPTELTRLIIRKLGKH